MSKVLRFAGFLLVSLAFVPVLPAVSPAQSKSTLASDKVAPARMNQYADLAVQWEREYLQIDTTNPPGNEVRGAAFFKKIFDQEGIENRVFEYGSGHADVWARLPHTTTNYPKRPIILLNHMDVVTADASHWTQPPFSANVANGSIYGRGAQDMKSEGLAQLMVVVMLKRENVPLDRDVIFLAVSDEEVDNTGSEWMIANQRDLLGNAEFLINEGGENLEEGGKAKYIGVDVGEKTPFWLHLVAHGRPGHGSRPIPESAPNRLVRALNKVIAYRTPIRVLPVVEEFLRQQAPHETGERALFFKNPGQIFTNKKFQAMVEKDESLNFLFHNTISLSMLGGSQQTNVIPPDAWANLDVRLLPGEDPKVFLDSIRRVINDSNVSVEPLSKDFRTANYSSTKTSLFEAIRSVTSHYYPGAPVLPRITSGYNECQRYRPLGINAYGFNPYTATSEESDTEHGNDERVDQVRQGFRVLYDVVSVVAAAK